MAVQDESRREVNKLIEDKTFYTMVRDQWSQVKSKITEWFSKYKDFEAADSFADAFADGRMTVRFIKQKAIIPDMRAWTKEALEPAIQTKGKRFKPIETWEDGQLIKRFEKEEFTTLTKVAGAEYLDTGQKLDTTMEGLCKRMKPDQFEGQANRLKYENGLHDLSASLLTRDRPISDQLFNVSKEAGAVVAFMPLSPPEDQVLFQKLSSLAKERNAHQNEDFIKLMNYIRSRMTRIKLACESDISANYVNVAPSNAQFPKYKYGIGLWSKVKNEEGIEVTKYVGKDEVLRRKALALDFRKILSPTQGKITEIIVAYRQHNNPIYPLFAHLRKLGTTDAPAYRYETFALEGRGLAGRVVTDQGQL